MRVIVAGPRKWTDRRIIWAWLDALRDKIPITVVIEGGAHGVDQMAREWALDRGIPVETFWAIWRPGGVLDRGAGPKRNRRMAESADALAAVDIGSRGTGDMIRVAREKGLIVRLMKHD